jgi:hypothetical protein
MLKKKRSKYDTAPPYHIFKEVQDKCVEYWWANFDDTHGYVAGKVVRIRGVYNHDDDYLFILKMFDAYHENACLATMNLETRKYIAKSKFAKGYIPIDNSEEIW